jgi:O-succinylbenzoic acid--CoA ligase
VALETPDERITYVEMLARAERAAAALAARGVRAGDRVAILLPPSAAFVETLHGCLLLGAAAMPIDPRLTEREREALADAAALIDVRLDGESGSLKIARPAPRDVALVVHTSGTTGRPKPVHLSFGNVQANALGSAIALGLDPDERWLAPLPLTHVAGLMVLLRSTIYATTVVLEPPPFDAARLRDDSITVVSLVPTMLQRVLDDGIPPGARLRCVLLGGAPATRALLARARDAGYPVQQTYGITEACSQVTVAGPGDLETVGHPLPGIAVELAPDGEILVTGATVAGGGTLRTGDLGRLDERGRLTVIGRKADTIITGGENVGPAEVEAVLLEHPAVADAGVFGRPDPEWGESVTARVVLRAAASPDELRAWCAARLAGFKVPKAVELADALPRTASGKLLRRKLPE